MKKEDHNPLPRSPYCGDPGALVSYLYNDGNPDELASIAAHVQSCDTCTSELAALGNTRELLSTWSPPQTELGLTLRSSDALPVSAVTMPVPAISAAVADVPWWRQSTPVWMQAVAATMVFAAGMTIGAGRGAAPAPAGSTATAVQPAPVQPAGVSKGELADLEQRLRADFARLVPASTPAPPPVQTASRVEDEALMKRVRTLLSESEEKQRGELALRTAQVLRDIEIQRKVDFATLQNDIGKIQGVTGVELRQQRELTNQLINRVGLQGGAK